MAGETRLELRPFPFSQEPYGAGLHRHIAAHLNFLGTHVGTLLRVIWFPVFILVLSGVFFVQKLLPYLPAPAERQRIGGLRGGDVVRELYRSGLAVPFVMSATAATGVLRFVILGEGAHSRAPIYVASGVPVLRVMAVTLILSAILILVALFVTLVGVTIAAVVPGFAALLPLISFGFGRGRGALAACLSDRGSGGRIDLQTAWSMARPIYPRLVALVLAVVLVVSLLDYAVDSVLGPINRAT